MAKTNSGLVEYVKAKVNDYYWFGTFGQMASKSLYYSKKSQYPDYYNGWSDFPEQIANPRQVFDCAGLIKAYLWTKDIDDTHPVYRPSQDYGATGFYDNAKEKGSISSFQKIAGQLVFKGNDSTKSHVGVYIGNDRVIEAKGHAYGVINSKFSSGGWEYWAQCHLIDKDDHPEPQPTPSTDKYDENLKGTWKVTAPSGLWLREGAGTDNDKITCMPCGSIVKCAGYYQTASDGDWLKITYDGQEGYSFKSWLEKFSEGSDTYQVTAPSGLWMRTGAGTDNSKIMCMSYGSICTSNGDTEDVDGTMWLKVSQYGKTGWSSSDWLRKL